MNKDEIKNDLDILEKKIEQLKVEYEKFFVGILTIEPAQLKNQINQIIRKYVSCPMNNVMLSFRYKNLVARFLTYQEYWNRILRLIEEGKNPKDYRKITERFQADAAIAQKEASAPATTDRYAELYSEYIGLLKKHDKKVPGEDAFRKTLNQYEENIKQKYGKNVEADFNFEESEKGIKIKTKIRRLK
jgi:hypothetical protein